MRQAFLIVGAGVFLGLLSNALGNAEPWGIRWIRQPLQLPPPAPPSSGGSATGQDPVDGIDGVPEAPELRTVGLDQAHALFDSRGAVFIDARHPALVDQGAIPGAVNLPWEEFEYYQSALDTIPLDTTIVTYCDGQGCELSIHLAEELAVRGYTNVLVFYGGWVDWVDAGYPVQKPEAVR